MYNKLVPLELDSNPIQSRADADLSRNVGNDTGCLRELCVGGPDLDRSVHSGFLFRTP
jgi:hypothetical protein